MQIFFSSCAWKHGRGDQDWEALLQHAKLFLHLFQFVHDIFPLRSKSSTSQMYMCSPQHFQTRSHSLTLACSPPTIQILLELAGCQRPSGSVNCLLLSVFTQHFSHPESDAGSLNHPSFITSKTFARKVPFIWSAFLASPPLP